MHRLILASQSPRRSELLTRSGYKFAVVSSQISEIPDENLNLTEQIQELARDKARAVVSQNKRLKEHGNLVLSADTVVVLDGQILGKPKDQEENRRFLGRLSGRSHQVITAVCLVDLDSGREVVGHDRADVFFRELSERDINAYVASKDGLDKAGGYGVQGMAQAFVERIDGAFDTVMGLPVALIERLFLENGWMVSRERSRD